MKTVFTSLSAIALASAIAASPTLAMPRLEPSTTTASTTPSVENARVVCNYRRCFRVGGYYRPYYYRPYYYRPGIGVRVGPFGVRVF